MIHKFRYLRNIIQQKSSIYLLTLLYLYLKGNNISDISPLLNLKNLQQVDLTNNPIPIDKINVLRDTLKNTEIIFR